MQLSNQSLSLLKEKKSILRKKFRNKNKQNYDKICNDLKILNVMAFNSIKNDCSKHMENKVKSFQVGNDIFKNIKKITNYKKRERIPQVLYENENREVKFVTEQEKAEALANHFEKVHQLTHNSVSLMESIVNDIYDKYDTNEPMVLFNDETKANFIDEGDEFDGNNIDTQNIRKLFTSTEELSEIIKTRNSKKSFGMDNTSNFMLKKMPYNFVTALSIIMNHIINTHYIPSAWKLGVITAIHKANKDSSLIASYRPITQLSVISKLLEKKSK